MRKHLLATCLSAVALCSAGYAYADDEQATLQKDAKQWTTQRGNYAATAYSELEPDQPTERRQAQVAWTFSTGVLRGHEGAPLVIGDMMYVHTPFPNIVYALDLNNDGKILWKYEPKQDPNVIPVMCCDTVNRGLAYGDGKVFLHQADTTLVALDAKTGKVAWSVKDGDPSKGRDRHRRAVHLQGQGVSSASPAASSACAPASPPTTSRTASWFGAATRWARTADTLIDPEKTTALGKPVGADSSTQDLAGRSVEDRRRRDLGLVRLRSRRST